MYETVHARFRATVRSTFMPFAICAGLFASGYASAQEYPARDVGGWMVAASKDKSGCFLSRTYDGTGATTVLFGLDIDGGNRLSVLNENWSIKPNERWKLSFRLSNGGYPNQLVVGIASDGKQGFVTNFEARFPDYLAASKALEIYRGAVPVEQLDLTGSGDAVAELRRCVALFRTKTTAGARGRRRSDRIPRDPFAPDAKPKPGG